MESRKPNRYSNKLELNEFHQLGPRPKAPPKTKAVSRLLRDQKRLLARLEKANVAITDEGREKLTMFEKRKSEEAKVRAITDKYKKFRFYELKKVIKALQGTKDEEERAELEKQRVYLKVN